MFVFVKWFFYLDLRLRYFFNNNLALGRITAYSDQETPIINGTNNGLAHWSIHVTCDAMRRPEHAQKRNNH